MCRSTPFQFIFLLQLINLIILGLLSMQHACIASVSKIPIGNILEYNFRVSWFDGAPNGMYRRILGVNNQFPGPTIRGKKGDLLRVYVTNAIQTKHNVSIHWHGIHQVGTPEQDGTEQVSQCPLVFGETQLYEFQLLQAGTHWWHSHHGPDLADGLWGLLIVDNDPEVWSHLYEYEVTVTLTDWFMKSGQEITDWFLHHENPEMKTPFPHSVLINGQGYYPCRYAQLQGIPCKQKSRAPTVIEVPFGSTVRVRVLSSSSSRNNMLSIDNHTMRCIETDGVDTELGDPVDVVRVNLGTRYSFLVEMNADGASVGSEFFIRAEMVKGLLDQNQNDRPNINPFMEEDVVPRTALAILRYIDGPLSRSALSKNSQSKVNLPKPKLKFEEKKPVTLVETEHCNALERAPDYYDEEIILTFEQHASPDGSPYFTTSGVRYELVEGQLPAFVRVMNNEPIPAYMNPFYTSANGSVIQIVINDRQEIGLGHPVHLHGHSFWIVGVGLEGEGDYNATKHAHRLKTRAPKRDTTRWPNGSWMVLRYIADNPGTWLFHCHVNWHVPAGMAAVFIEGDDAMRKKYSPLHPEIRDVCRKAGLLKNEDGLGTSEDISGPGWIALNSVFVIAVVLIGRIAIHYIIQEKLFDNNLSLRSKARRERYPYQKVKQLVN